MVKRKENSDQNAVAELTREGLYKENKWLWEENKKLKEINESQNEEIQRFKDNAMQDMREITELEIENKKLKKTIKDRQLYEEKLEHRIIEFEELLHGE